VTLQVTLRISGSGLSTQDLSVSVVAPTLVGILGGVDPLDPAALKSYQVDFDDDDQGGTRRRLLQQSGAADSAAAVSFSVTGSLPSLGYATAAEFEAAVSAALAGAISDGSLASNLEQNCLCGPLAFQDAEVALARQTYPTLQPTPLPTQPPSPLPSEQPTPIPFSVPSQQPSPLPTAQPTLPPTPLPSLEPTARPSPLPTPPPTQQPNPLPTAQPTPLPSARPRPLPTAQPTPLPSTLPTALPSIRPSPLPTAQPTHPPSSLPTHPPSWAPTALPTEYGCRFGYMNMTCGETVTLPLFINLSSPEYRSLAGPNFAESGRSDQVSVIRFHVPKIPNETTQVVMSTCHSSTTVGTALAAFDFCPDPWAAASDPAYIPLRALGANDDDPACADAGPTASASKLLIDVSEESKDVYLLVRRDSAPNATEGPPLAPGLFTFTLSITCTVATPAPSPLPSLPPTPAPSFEFVTMLSMNATVQLEFATAQDFAASDLPARALAEAFSEVVGFFEPGGVSVGRVVDTSGSCLESGHPDASRRRVTAHRKGLPSLGDGDESAGNPASLSDEPGTGVGAFRSSVELGKDGQEHRRLGAEWSSLVPPNSSATLVTLVRCGGTTRGHLAQDAEIALFEFRPDAPTRIKATTCEPGGLRTRLDLYQGSQSPEVFIADEAPDFNCSILVFDIHDASETFWVSVQSYDGATWGTFALTLICTVVPSPAPTLAPSPSPSTLPSALPTALPSYSPSPPPSRAPTPAPSPAPSAAPRPQPSSAPSPRPSTPPPTAQPSRLPTTLPPTPLPTVPPSRLPTPLPSLRPSPAPSRPPTRLPSARPSLPPSHAPTVEPSLFPTPLPTLCTTVQVDLRLKLPFERFQGAYPTVPALFQAARASIAEEFRADAPTFNAALKAAAHRLGARGILGARAGSTCCAAGLSADSDSPTAWALAVPPNGYATEKAHLPTWEPTAAPSPAPSLRPSDLPTAGPSRSPTRAPTFEPTDEPSPLPSARPTHPPTEAPTRAPTWPPSAEPSPPPTPKPSPSPTPPPSEAPKAERSAPPTAGPVQAPTPGPSQGPTAVPAVAPSSSPTEPPVLAPTSAPTPEPSAPPTPGPTDAPSLPPSPAPSPAPTSSTRGFRDCVCVSALTVEQIKVHCPDVAQHFSAESCLNMTAAELDTIADDCKYLPRRKKKKAPV